MIDIKEMRAKYAKRGRFTPAGAKDVLALCDEVDRLFRHNKTAGHCETCKHANEPYRSAPCRGCTRGSKWEEAP